MTPNLPLNTYQSKVLFMHERFISEAQILAFSLYHHFFSRHKVAENRKCLRMIPNWTWALNSQKYSIYTELLTPEAQIVVLVRFALRLVVFEIHVEVGDNQKCSEWPQSELEHLTVKRTLYALDTYPWGPNFRLFCSMIRGFQDTMLPKMGNAPNDPKLNLHT